VPATSATIKEIRQGVRAKEKLITLIETGKAQEAEAAWHAYLNRYAERIGTRIPQQTHSRKAAE
jgi:hypothetical protein